MSANWIHRIKNIGTTYFHDPSGLNFVSGQYIDISILRLPLICDALIEAKFSSGDFIFNDGTTDYNTYPENFNRLVRSAFGIPFLNDSIRSNNLLSENTQEAIEEVRDLVDTNVIGGIYQTHFSANGTVVNEWLETHDNSTSDETHHIAPYNMKLIAVWVSNSNSNRTFDIQLYRSPTGNTNPSSNDTIIYEIDVSGARNYRKSGFTPEITVNEGDRLAVYVPNTSNDPSDISVMYIWQITSYSTYEVIENYSGDF
jgi:hypothetical protein